MPEPKIYKIDGIDFELNTDLDLDEAEEVQKFFSITSNKNFINLGSFKKEEVMRLYSIILKPASGKALPINFSFSKIKETTQIDVIKDFFLSRIEKMVNLQKSLSVSTGQLSKH